MFNEPVVLIYIVIFAVSLVLAYFRRKTFPFGESLAVMLIVGVGFTLAVHFIAPAAAIPLSYALPNTSEIVFTLAYVVFVAALLTRDRPMPAGWKGDFAKEKLAALAFKLAVFVLIPFGALYIIWRRDLPSLGFSVTNLPAQLMSSLALILLFGGFNFIAGSGAAPIRKKEFPAHQVALGLGIAFVWNIFEVGLVEEFFFRAFLQTRLMELFGSAASGILAASLLFGLAHAPGLYLRAADKGGPLGGKPALIDAILYTILVLSPAGWFTGLLFFRTQSLLAPVLVHAGMDAVAHASDFIKGLKFCG
ncbi:MAG: CPBP family intramembrane glutamic endopeptidase [Chloroflexota bacterium]